MREATHSGFVTALLGRSIVAAAFTLGLAGCSSPPLTLRGSVPCPPGTGSVESWCDDAGHCEFRVTTGGVFSCRAGDDAGCAAAAGDAAEACRSVGVIDGPDGGTTSGCESSVPCVSDAQCAATPGTSCNTNSNRCQTVLCGGLNAPCSSPDHCVSGLSCTAERCTGTAPPESRSYVISALDLREPVGPEAVGFNLDGMISSASTEACNDAVDFASPSGGAGVDNNLSAIAPILPGGAASFEPQITSGALLLILEVSDINDYVTDAQVGVRMYLGTSPSIILSGGHLAPNQTFVPIGPDLVNVADAAIVAGTLEIASPTLPLSVASAVLREVHLRAQILPEALSGGEVGGQLTIPDTASLLDELAGSSGSLNEDTVRALNLPDLEPNADGSVCDAVSVGLSFSAIPANPR